MKPIKKVTVEYEDGVEETFTGQGVLMQNKTYRVEEYYVEGEPKPKSSRVDVSQIWVSLNV
jgi:hypothetical protein